MKNTKETYLALPGGEWFKSLMRTIDDSGLQTKQNCQRDYLVRLPKLGINGVVVRSKEVPTLVSSQQSSAVAGFTGTDILVEQKIRTLTEAQQGQDWLVPLDEKAPQPQVYLGTTPNLEQTESTALDTILMKIMEGVHRYCLSCSSATILRI